MKERPILFSAPMVRAILEGRKTMTRRIVKPQPNGHHWEGVYGYAFSARCYDTSDGLSARFQHHLNGVGEEPLWVKSPYGKPGDRLWVKETFGRHQWEDSPIHYRATEPEWKDKKLNPNAKWRPSIFMPKNLSRITLEITGVRVERLNDISEKDARHEGLIGISKDGLRTIKYGIPDNDGYPGNDNHGWHWKEWEISLRLAFKKLWESINGPGSWNKNPLVWVIIFKRVKA